MQRSKPKRHRRRWVEAVRAILRIAFGALLLALLAGTAGAQGHAFRIPEGVVVDPAFPRIFQFLPDARYEQWWHEIAACEGLPLPPVYVFVKWVAINSPYFADSARATREAEYGLPMSRALAISALLEWQTFVSLGFVYDEEAIKHEMLHWLLFWNRISVGGHPAPYYGRCGVTELYHGGPYSDGR